MLEHMKRVVAERDELLGRLSKLERFLGGKIFLSLDKAEQARLDRQAEVMQQYLDVLNERIAAF